MKLNTPGKSLQTHTPTVTLKTAERERKIFKVTLVGSVVNVVLTVFKFIAGIAGHSAAMTADAVHSLSDLLTDGDGYSAKLESSFHKTIKKVSDDLETLKYNTAIAAMMSLLN